MKSLFTLAFCWLVTIPSVFLLSRFMSLFWTGVIALMIGFIGANVSCLIWEVFIEPWMEDDGV